MRNPRQRDPRKLNLTIRLIAPKGTPRDVLLAALDKSIRYESVQAPITEIRWMNWKKGEEGGPVAQGAYVPPQLWAALKDFYAAITHPRTRLRIGQVEP